MHSWLDKNRVPWWITHATLKRVNYILNPEFLSTNLYCSIDTLFTFKVLNHKSVVWLRDLFVLSSTIPKSGKNKILWFNQVLLILNKFFCHKTSSDLPKINSEKIRGERLKNFKAQKKNLLEHIQHFSDRVPAIENRFPRHGPEGLVRLGQLLLEGGEGLLQVHLLPAQIIPLPLQFVLLLLELVETLVLIVNRGSMGILLT